MPGVAIVSYTLSNGNDILDGAYVMSGAPPRVPITGTNRGCKQDPSARFSASNWGSYVLEL